MKQEILDLQSRMKEAGVDVYFVPSGDDHNSEYFADYFKCCEFLTGFVSEAAELVVTAEDAALWTDGRYFLQAERELKGSGVQLMKMGEAGVPSVLDYLVDLLYDERYFHKDGTKGYVLGFDGRLVTQAKKKQFEESLAPLGVTMKFDLDLVGDIWKDRPPVPVTPICRLPLRSAGIPSSTKMADMIHAMSEGGATHLLLSDLCEIAWLTNLRASDIAYTPVFYGYLLLSWDQAELFVHDNTLSVGADGVPMVPERYIGGYKPENAYWTLTPGSPENLPAEVPQTDPFEEARRKWEERAARAAQAEMAPPKAPFRPTPGSQQKEKSPMPKGSAEKLGISDPENLSFLTIRRYDDIDKAIRALPAGSTLWYDPSVTSAHLAGLVPDGVEVIERPTPANYMKAIKNRAEIKSTLEAHIKDGRAMVEFLRWLRRKRPYLDDPDSRITEMDAAAKLDSIRLKQPGCFELSFQTIAAYGPNAAVIHYAPNPKTNARIRPEGFLLVDSGGQYWQGTTDITRTIAMGPLTDKMKEYYTYVLKSHITLASAIISPETTGAGLDTLARRPLRDHDLDFRHGISHGIGHVLSVHEGPNGIRRSARACTIGPGMIQSDEPGVYLKDDFGIRIENEIICTENEDGNYYFIPITYCPYEREAIVPELLTDEELEWVNSYHEAVYDVLSPRLSEDLRKFLREETRPIRKK